MTKLGWLLAGGGLYLLAAFGHVGAGASERASPAAAQPEAVVASAHRAVLDRYCVTCHNQRRETAGLALDTLDLASVGDHGQVWEQVVRKLRAGLMPPAGRPRPDETTYDALASWLESRLDAAVAERPNPGRTQPLHRLNRAEYQNAVRDVLALDIDVAELLPADNASYGFDNMAGVLRVSESLMERYLTAARRISRAAVGNGPPAAVAQTYTVSPALPQDGHLDGLPFGTRGGTLVTHRFPLDAEYVLRAELSRVTDGTELAVMVDGNLVELFELKRGAPSLDLDGNEVGENLDVRLFVAAGSREIGVAFLKTPVLLPETPRRAFLNPTVSRRRIPYLRSLTVTGPFDARGPGDTASRRRIFVCQPEAHEAACARTILSSLARRAYRRPVEAADLDILEAAYRAGRAGADFDAGIERALQQLLVSPHFLFRVEAPPAAGAGPEGPNYRLGDLALASRLSFFLWSSVPDAALLDAAVAGTLSDPLELERQVRRMLRDERARALTDNFVGQWLQLRNLDAVRPSQVLFADFDDGLREAFRRETELFFGSIVTEDRSVLDLLAADYTFVNDRLARHYGFPQIQGSHFRRVPVISEHRGGLLGHGSILTITSHPVRTSPVFRGKWILTNILGTPPPDPPPNVPPLPDKGGAYAGSTQSMRERMAAHRDNPACASCHAMIDPLGFGLERFDAVGRLRDVDEQYQAIDASGVLPDGTPFNDVPELRAALLRRPERFVSTFTERLLTYALGRGLEYYDMPAVRTIVREAAADGYRMPSVIMGIVRSLPFRERRIAPDDVGAH